MTIKPQIPGNSLRLGERNKFPSPGSFCKQLDSSQECVFFATTLVSPTLPRRFSRGVALREAADWI